MKILFLSFYYKPDLCAGSFRSQSLVEELQHRLSENDSLTVLTTYPQRYKTFRQEADPIDDFGNVKIIRFKLPEHDSGFVDQAKSFYSFYRQVNNYVKKENYDIVFATSSRLLTAFLGARIARKKKTKLILDIRDIFRDTLKSILNRHVFFFVNVPFKLIEQYTFSKANKINLVSEGFKTYFEERFTSPHYSYFYNGIDEMFFDIDFTKKIESKAKIICYAGNIGQGQGLSTIVPLMASALGNQYLIRIIGDGGEKSLLEKRLNDAKIENVELIPPVKREELISIYAESDYLFLHLNDLPAFEKVLPSKVFEYAITGKKIIAGVGGFAASFIKNNIPEAIVFEPNNINSFMQEFKNKADENTEINKDFVTRFNRKLIAREMVASLFEID